MHDQREDSDRILPKEHFVAALGIALHPGEGWMCGRTQLTPAMWCSGLHRPRLAILATMVDVVAGHVPDGPRTPTIDLRIQTLAEPPEAGEIELVARPDRVGRKLIVSETLLRVPGARPFARARTTFMNHQLPATPFRPESLQTSMVDSFEGMLNPRVVTENALELVPRPELSNGAVGTVQGGVQALLAELAAERLLGGAGFALDLDIRYLSRVKRGPLRARAELQGRTGDLQSLGVTLCDAGDEDRTVGVVSLLMQAA